MRKWVSHRKLLIHLHEEKLLSHVPCPWIIEGFLTNHGSKRKEIISPKLEFTIKRMISVPLSWKRRGEENYTEVLLKIHLSKLWHFAKNLWIFWLFSRRDLLTFPELWFFQRIFFEVGPENSFFEKFGKRPFLLLLEIEIFLSILAVKEKVLKNCFVLFWRVSILLADLFVIFLPLQRILVIIRFGTRESRIVLDESEEHWDCGNSKREKVFLRSLKIFWQKGWVYLNN